MDPVIVEVRGGKEEVDPVMEGQSGAARRCTLLRGVTGGQRGGVPCYRGSEGAARWWTLS